MKSAYFEKEVETFYSTIKSDADILSKLNHLERMYLYSLSFL